MARKPTGQPTGRPKKIVNWEQFEQFCGLQCTSEEIASCLHISKDTLYDKVQEHYGESFSTVFKKFSEHGKTSLRRNQFVLSRKNASMAIWLGKQMLGQRDPDKGDTFLISQDAAALAMQQILDKTKHPLNSRQHPSPIVDGADPITAPPLNGAVNGS